MKTCPRCGADLVSGIAVNPSKLFPKEIMVCKDGCGYSEECQSEETISDRNNLMNTAPALLMESPVQGVSVVEQAAKEFVLQKEKDITTAIIRSCVAVNVDPDALAKTAHLNAELKSQLYGVIDRFSWVSCEERLPHKEKEYLVVVKSPMTGYQYQMIIMFYENRGFYTGSEMVATHWMELPELPKEDSDNE